ncbi:MAG: TolC family protein [Candidatus Omnitrophota bacterium]
MKRIIPFLILFGFIFPIIVNAEEITLSLDEAIVIALRDNPDVLLKTEEVKKAKFKIAEGKAGLFPALNWTGSWTDTRGLYVKDTGQTSTGFSVKQYLYKGGKIVNTIKYNGYGFDVAETVLDKTKQDVIWNVQKTFWTLLLAREAANLNKSIVENTAEHLNFINQRFDNGQASESDVLKMRASLDSVNEVYETALNQVLSSAMLLGNLLGLDKDVNINLDAQFSCDKREVAFDEAFIKAMKNRPEIRQYEIQIQADKKAIEISQADSRPNIYASWDYYNRSHLSAGTTKNWNDYNVIGLTFSWPVFDGWLTQAKVDQAIVDLKQTRVLKDKTIKDIALELKNAYLALKNAINGIKTAESDIVVYERELARIKQEKDKAIASFLDFDDANLKYSIALFGQKQAIYDYIIAKCSFEKATGG